MALSYACWKECGLLDARDRIRMTLEGMQHEGFKEHHCPCFTMPPGIVIHHPLQDARFSRTEQRHTWLQLPQSGLHAWNVSDRI